MVVYSTAGHASPRIESTVRRYVAYHHEGMEPGTHLGLPSPSITVVLSIGAPTQLVTIPSPGQAPDRFMALIGGLHMRPVVIGYGEEMAGIQLDLTPQAARRLFGVPASELTHRVTDMHDVIGDQAQELVDRLQTSDTWNARRDAVFDVLGRRDPASSRPATTSTMPGASSPHPTEPCRWPAWLTRSGGADGISTGSSWRNSG